MTRFANRKSVLATASAASLAVCLVLAVMDVSKAVADSGTQAPAAAPAQSPAAPGTPQQSNPAFRPGFPHQLKSWWDDSLSVFDRKNPNPRDANNDVSKKPEDTSPGVSDRAKDAAASAVTTTQDAM